LVCLTRAADRRMSGPHFMYVPQTRGPHAMDPVHGP
jgi:hypothetical protein